MVYQLAPIVATLGRASNKDMKAYACKISINISFEIFTNSEGKVYDYSRLESLRGVKNINTINSLCVVRVEARCQIADPITIEMSTSNQIRLTQRRSQYWTDGAGDYT